jgi:DNA-binding CsgD family transcriptional regulator
LIGAIDAAARGQPSLSPDATAVVLDHVRTYPDRRRAADTETDLSWRELEVLALLVEGKENMEIAQALSISSRTVKHHHISSIFVKLNVPKPHAGCGGGALARPGLDIPGLRASEVHADAHPWSGVRSPDVSCSLNGNGQMAH